MTSRGAFTSLEFSKQLTEGGIWLRPTRKRKKPLSLTNRADNLIKGKYTRFISSAGMLSCIIIRRYKIQLLSERIVYFV